MAGGDQTGFGGESAGQPSFGVGRFMGGSPNLPGAGQSPGLAPWSFRVPTPTLPAAQAPFLPPAAPVPVAASPTYAEDVAQAKRMNLLMLQNEGGAR